MAQVGNGLPWIVGAAMGSVLQCMMVVPRSRFERIREVQMVYNHSMGAPKLVDIWAKHLKQRCAMRSLV